MGPRPVEIHNVEERSGIPYTKSCRVRSVDWSWSLTAPLAAAPEKAGASRLVGRFFQGAVLLAKHTCNAVSMGEKKQQSTGDQSGLQQ